MKLQRFDHVAFTVADLQRAAAFYGALGFEPVRRFSSAGPDVDAAADVARADMDIQLLRHPLCGLRLELIRYVHHPAGRAAHNSHVGAAHLAFAVEEITSALDELAAAGAQLLSQPRTDQFGMRWVYLRDPDGNVVELVQDPVGAT